MRKFIILLTAAGMAIMPSLAQAQNSTRNIAPNNIAPSPQPCIGFNCNQPPPPPGPVIGQNCPPGYAMQVTQDQWGRTIGITCIPPQGGQPQNPIGGVIGGIIGGIIAGGGNHRHRHCHGGTNCHTHEHHKGHH
jgi:hypothetical protein